MNATPTPVAPGKSPFHVRGSTYIGIRAHIDEKVVGGLSAVLSLLPDEAHQVFCTQVFLPVATYDALPMRTLTEATALAEGSEYAHSVRKRARVVAQRDISGLYKLLFKAVSPATAAERLQKAALRYFDFGDVTILDKGSKHSIISHGGIPRFIIPWYTPMIEGYTAVVLEIAGARNPAARTEIIKRDGEREGIETVIVRVELSWG